MRHIFLGFALALGLAACGGDQKPAGPACEETYAACEWDAFRHDSFVGYFYVRDCSWNYGTCIGQLGETDCDTWCNTITWVPSECLYSCQAYGPQTKTSTTGG